MLRAGCGGKLICFTKSVRAARKVNVKDVTGKFKYSINVFNNLALNCLFKLASPSENLFVSCFDDVNVLLPLVTSLCNVTQGKHHVVNSKLEKLG